MCKYVCFLLLLNLVHLGAVLFHLVFLKDQISLKKKSMKFICAQIFPKYINCFDTSLHLQNKHYSGSRCIRKLNLRGLQ